MYQNTNTMRVNESIRISKKLEPGDFSDEEYPDELIHDQEE
jgi:hypothetical protein